MAYCKPQSPGWWISTRPALCKNTQVKADIPTLFLTIIVVGAVLSLSVGAVAKRSRRDGLLYWAAGLAAHTLAYILFSQRGQVNDFVSIVGANVLLSCSFAAFTEGLYEFYQRPPPRALVWAPVGILFLAFAALLDNLTLRVITSGLIFATQGLLALLFMWHKRRDAVGRGRYFVAAGLFVVTTMLLMRAIRTATSAASTMSSLTESSPIQTLTFLAALISLMLLSIGFVLMSKDRADALNRILATRDELTGLANRRRLNETLANEWARAKRSDQSLALVMIDIDHFKDYNDHYGHQAGDECLKRVAIAIQAAAQRAGDLAARYGGEEFLLILPDTEAAAARQLAEDVRQSIESFDWSHASSPSGKVTVSIGIAALTNACYKDAESLLLAADQALYHAKKAGRNQVQVSPESLAQAELAEPVSANMVQLTWRAAYESGNEVIDRQHRALFGQANKLLSAVLTGLQSREVSALLDLFLADVAQHFQDEEAIIRAAGYPGAAEHAGLHRELIEKAASLAERYRAGTLSLGDLFQYLAYDVVARHMLSTDRDFFPCLEPRSRTA